MVAHNLRDYERKFYWRPHRVWSNRRRKRVWKIGFVYMKRRDGEGGVKS